MPTVTPAKPLESAPLSSVQLPAPKAPVATLPANKPVQRCTSNTPQATTSSGLATTSRVPGALNQHVNTASDAPTALKIKGERCVQHMDGKYRAAAATQAPKTMHKAVVDLIENDENARQVKFCRAGERSEIAADLAADIQPWPAVQGPALHPITHPGSPHNKFLSNHHACKER